MISIKRVARIFIILWVSKIRYLWSNQRMQPVKKLYHSDYSKYIPKNYCDIEIFLKDIYKRFVWTRDSLGDLFDLMESPEYCWYQMIHNAPLRDDCDGFHAGIYWALQNDYDCRLLTVIPSDITQSHTLLVIESKGKYSVIDYYEISEIIIGANIDKILDAVNKLSYQNKEEFLYYEFSKWSGSKWMSDNNWIT